MSTAKIKIAYYSQPDKRRLATQRKLFTALQQMYAAGIPIADIRVTALCQAAHVTRQTFYRHYQTVDEIVVDNMILVANEIVVDNMILVANQFLLAVDNTIAASRTAATTMVELMLANTTAFAMIFWAHADEQVVQLITSDMRRVNNYSGGTTPAEAFKLELFARAIISFARVMTTHPALNRETLIQIYKQTVPAPETIFDHE